MLVLSGHRPWSHFCTTLYLSLVTLCRNCTVARENGRAATARVAAAAAAAARLAAERRVLGGEVNGDVRLSTGDKVILTLPCIYY